MTIIVDPNEPKEIKYALAMNRIPYKVEKSVFEGDQSGDFTNTERTFVAERKLVYSEKRYGGKIRRSSDLFSSLVDGRLEEQCKKMYLHFKGDRYLILEGDYFALLDWKKGRRNWIESRIVYLQKKYDIHVVPTRDHYHTVRAVRWMDRYTSIDVNVIERDEPIVKNKDPRVRTIMASVKGIGEKTAINLLNEFKTVSGVFSAPAEEIAERVNGIGPKFSRRLELVGRAKTKKEVEADS